MNVEQQNFDKLSGIEEGKKNLNAVQNNADDLTKNKEKSDKFWAKFKQLWHTVFHNENKEKRNIKEDEENREK